MDPLLLRRTLRAFLGQGRATTRRARRGDLEDFRLHRKAPSIEAAVGELLANGVGQAHELAEAYLETMHRQRELAPATINRRLSTLRSLSRRLRQRALLEWTLEIRGLRQRGLRDTRGPGSGAVAKMAAVLDQHRTAKAVRDLAILRLAFDLALRRGEIVALDLRDVDLPRRRLAVAGKGHDEKDWLELPPVTVEALAHWLGVRGTQGGPLFGNFDRGRKGSGRLTGAAVYYILQALGRKIGARVRPHGLRHSAITEAVRGAQQAGIGLEEVLQFSRHADIKTLLVYRDRERNVQGRLARLVAARATPAGGPTAEGESFR